MGDAQAAERAVSCLHSYLQVLVVAAEPSVSWRPAQLLAAFQWAQALQGLAEHEGLALVLREEMEALAPTLPRWVRRDAAGILARPPRALLARLLRAGAGAPPGGGAARLQAVVGAYTAACVLPAPPARQQDAERDLVEAIAGLAAEAEAARLAGEALAQAAPEAALRARLSAGADDSDAARLAAEAVAFFCSPRVQRGAAAAALLLAAAREPGAPRLGDLLPPGEGAAARAEVAALALLLPRWEQLLGGLAGGGALGGPGGAFGGAPPGGWGPAEADLEAYLCDTLRGSLGEVLAGGVHPALPAAAAAASPRLAAALRDGVRALPPGAAAAAAALRAHAALVGGPAKAALCGAGAAQGDG